MSQSNTLVMRRSIILWVATAAVIAFNLFAASAHDGSLTYAALLLTGAMALFGIGFGLWAASTLSPPAGVGGGAPVRENARFSWALCELERRRSRTS